MIRQNIQYFKLGTLRHTKVTASCGLALLMSFAKEIGLGKRLEFYFSHLKRRNRGYSVSAKILSFMQMIIKDGDRVSDIDLLRADPGLQSLLRMDAIPRSNTLAELSRKFRLSDIHRLAECVMQLVVRALRLRKLRRVVLDIDSTLIESGVLMPKTSSGSSKKAMRSTISSQKSSWPTLSFSNSSFFHTTWLNSSSTLIWSSPGGGCESNSCVSG